MARMLRGATPAAKAPCYLQYAHYGSLTPSPVLPIAPIKSRTHPFSSLTSKARPMRGFGNMGVSQAPPLRSTVYTANTSSISSAASRRKPRHAEAGQ